MADENETAGTGARTETGAANGVSADAGRGGAAGGGAPSSDAGAGTTAQAPDPTADAAKPGAAKTAPDAQAAKEEPVPDWAKDVPAQFRGKDERETIQRLVHSQADVRKHLSTIGAPVKDIAEFDFKPNEKTAPYLGEKGDVDLAHKVLGVFQQLGVGKMQGSALLNGVMEAVIDMELVDPPVDPARERAQLLPPEARVLSKAEQDNMVDRRVLKAQATVKAMQAEGLPEASAVHLVSALSTAGGVQLVEFLAERMGTTSPVTGASMGAPMGEADINKLIATTPRDDLEGQKRITERMRQLYGGARR